ncbi:MAG: hypothetical protein KDD62_12960, partial [Bdellovibrionales bacterium]|nr:hypothetical protein [Bdellovibrionales bacterium]
MNNYVICLHGLGRTRFSMRYLCRRIRREGYKTLLYGYHSRRSKLAVMGSDFAAYTLRHIPDHSRVSFVGHSLGCLLVRLLLEDTATKAELAERDISFHRAVFLGPPNRGAELAQKLQKTKLSGFILGPVLDDIAGL